jgi:hypothetical protein
MRPPAFRYSPCPVLWTTPPSHLVARWLSLGGRATAHERINGSKIAALAGEADHRVKATKVKTSRSQKGASSFDLSSSCGNGSDVPTRGSGTSA